MNQKLESNNNITDDYDVLNNSDSELNWEDDLEQILNSLH